MNIFRRMLLWFRPKPVRASNPLLDAITRESLVILSEQVRFSDCTMVNLNELPHGTLRVRVPNRYKGQQ